MLMYVYAHFPRVDYYKSSHRNVCDYCASP